jgi:DNA-binding transcriptional ArsR family regulator
MPLHLNESQDNFTSLTSFQISPVFEMIVSLQAFTHPWRVRKWTEKVTAIMGESFQQELITLYTAHNIGCDFIECAADYPDQGNIPGFINYVRDMPVNRFIFYLLGRIIPIELIPENGDMKKVQHIQTSYMEKNSQEVNCVIPGTIDDIPTVRKQITDLWELYWNRYFQKESENLYTIWEDSIREQERFLIRNGGKPLMKKISGHDKMPRQIPENMPYSSIRYIPIYRIHKECQIYFGYGNITVLYDASMSDKRTIKVQQLKTSILTTLKALGDENRLKILKLVADSYQKLNGKMIAEKVGLSQSVVSRHLGQLKEAGLIKEFSPDNRNITYTIEWDIISLVSSGLQNYLEAGSELFSE